MGKWHMAGIQYVVCIVQSRTWGVFCIVTRDNTTCTSSSIICFCTCTFCVLKSDSGIFMWLHLWVSLNLDRQSPVLAIFYRFKVNVAKEAGCCERNKNMHIFMLLPQAIPKSSLRSILYIRGLLLRSIKIHHIWLSSPNI